MTGEPAALRPCPFCGTHNPHRMNSQNLQFWVSCSRPFCARGSTERCEVDADDAWNRRDPAAVVVDPEDEAQRDIVAEALGSGLVPDRFKIARAVLTALRDAARGAGG